MKFDTLVRKAEYECITSILQLHKFINTVHILKLILHGLISFPLALGLTIQRYHQPFEQSVQTCQIFLTLS